MLSRKQRTMNKKNTCSQNVSGKNTSNNQRLGSTFEDLDLAQALSPLPSWG